MSTENPVFQLLVTSGNQAPLAAGSRIGALAAGQIGIFNKHTGLSVDGSVPANTQDIELVVMQADGDIIRSSGQMIQKRNVKAWTIKGYTAAVAKVVELAGFKAKCETDYSLKVEFRNQKAYGVYGYNGFTKTFNYRTGCCVSTTPCDTCPQGDAVELAVGLAARINNDPDALITATFFANKLNVTVTAATADGNVTFKVGAETFVVAVLNGDTATQVATKLVAGINSTTTSGYYGSNAAGVITIYPKASVSNSTAAISLTSAGGTGVTFGTITNANVNVTDTAAFEAAYPGVGLALRITTVAQTAQANNGHIPVKYYNAKETDILVSLTDSFTCNGTVTTITELQYADGTGVNLAYDEYIAGGWNGKPGPYRTSAITGLERGNYNSLINPASNYTVMTIEYDIFSVGGWQEFLNNNRTIIAIPCADSTTLTGLVTMLDLIFTQFGAMTNDASDIDCTNTNVSVINDYALDGIESLA